MKQLFLVFFSFIIVGLYAQTTVIPDVNFEQRLIFFGYDSGSPDGVVLTSNINNVSYLDVSGTGISDLTGIQDFSALTNFVCSNNYLSSIDFSQNSNLSYLDCSNNQLSNINLPQNSSLSHLDCSYNQLINVDFSQSSSLSYLNCSDNQITSLDVSQNNLLDTIGCINNLITNLDVSQNNSLKFLKCSDNLLTSINVNGASSLEYFNCADNSLLIIDVSQNLALKHLIFHENQIANIDVSNNLGLLQLGCIANQLTSIDVSNNSNLIEIECNGNQIVNLDLSMNSSLTKVECSYCPLLSCLNLQNGNNHNINSMWTEHSPNLLCIEVDDAAWSQVNWIGSLGAIHLDPQNVFSENCNSPCVVSVEGGSLDVFSINPNPTKGTIRVDFDNVKSNIKVVLFDLLGNEVFSKVYHTISHVDFSIEVPKGLYVLKLDIDGVVETRKIIKN